MLAKDAIPILNKAISELESIEASWKNCRACPHSGKCCDDAFIEVVFPEEAKAIAEHLISHPEKLVYAKERASRRKSCYFHNPHANECLIHSVRPILCRWTPYTALTDYNSIVARIRDERCNFTPVRKIDSVKKIQPGIIEVIPYEGTVKQQKFLHLQGIEALHPLLRRAHEAIDMDAVLALSLEKK
ncbi:YkgJ family cysteine cluster protein [Klebsiella michiganensis]|uniref:YkgJ family cysteine cluster protein n=1 Tax=Klebsiella michiganensis TaxID=1134687 RepID=UPI001E3A5147|nr:YkgJ family cysteine cluster protein [Klebsiella michiganensis]UHC89225.1 YkgJ family cysteine cluster protein [Klebsiella michiganensis]